MARARSLIAGLGSLIALPAARLAGQQSPASYPELRADGVFGAGSAVQAGAGLVVPAGVYVRVAADGLVGETWRSGASATAGRAEVVARFLLDPLREAGVGLSVGGGLSMPVGQGRARAPYLTVVVDVEGRRHAGFSPALQIGLGGGARVGVALRRSPPRWR